MFVFLFDTSGYSCDVHGPLKLNIIVKTRAATNDYFDNRLVGRLFFRLID